MLQKLDGEGRAWVELGGEVTSYDLPPGQTVLVHPGHIGMFQGTVQFSITRIQGIKNMMFGGDGLHLVALTGPGRVWLQSMPVPMLAHALAPYLSGGADRVGRRRRRWRRDRRLPSRLMHGIAARRRETRDRETGRRRRIAAAESAKRRGSRTLHRRPAPVAT